MPSPPVINKSKRNRIYPQTDTTSSGDTSGRIIDNNIQDTASAVRLREGSGKSVILTIIETP